MGRGKEESPAGERLGKRGNAAAGWVRYSFSALARTFRRVLRIDNLNSADKGVW